MEKAKLVIWDLDETFWKGTLSEGGITPIIENVELVKTLVDRGIMNSIVSKNDFEKVKEVLEELDIFSLFIFPQVSWNPKGQIVKELLDTCKLRAENVLFMDDNTSNLEEVKFYNPGIHVSLPLQAEEILSNPAFAGKDDSSHSRLAQYHLMESRVEAKSQYNSNESFLRSSNIKISICDDCLAVEDRVFELIQRTNQLNYTKLRCNKEELHDLLDDSSYECRYIKVKDDFGDYGITGFYAIKDGELKHFLFSCRTIGFGVENYLYAKLGYPKLIISGEVSTELSKTSKVDWITETDKISNTANEKANDSTSPKVLMISGCDLEQAYAYLQTSLEIDREFATIVGDKLIRTSDTVSLVNTLYLSAETKKELGDYLPFIDTNITFGTKIYSGKYDVIILSVVDDYIRGLYQHRKDGYYVGFLSWMNQETEKKERYPIDRYKYLDENFNYIGKETKELFWANLEEIVTNIPSKTQIILINGVELDISDWIGEESVNRNKEMNAVVDSFVSCHDNVSLLDMRKIVTTRKMLVKHDNRHFNREVYYMMAKEISCLINNSTQMGRVKTVNPLSLYIREVRSKILKKFTFLKKL